MTLKTLARFFDSVEPTHAALAMVAEGALGLVHSIHPLATTALFKAYSLRRMLVAAASAVPIEHIYADARRRAASLAYWLTHESNHDARRLYHRIADRSGFINY